MRRLDVSVEMNGRMREVGSITGDNEYTAVFSYSQDYLTSSSARPISISLPLREEPYDPFRTGVFFEGLLPEGFLRRKISEDNRTDSNDYLTLLEMLGSECLGAIQIKGENFDAVRPEYRPLEKKVLEELAAEGASASAELVVEARLSLTGASGKIGVYRDERGDWFLPVGSAPSTHILKQSHIRYDSIIQNEQLSMKTAENMGLDVPRSLIVDAGGKGAEGGLLFASERFDRSLGDSVTEISGLPAPRRLHQEDLGQALGIPAADKYEKAGRQYMKRMFDLIAARSGAPIADQQKLWDIIVFHYLMGNTDGHIKNFSLLYDSGLNAVRLAPAYDMISTVIYQRHSSKMAFTIGDELEWSRLGRDNFEAAAEEIGLSRRMFIDRFDDMNDRFGKALDDAADELAAAGYTEVRKIAGKLKEIRGLKA